MRKSVQLEYDQWGNGVVHTMPEIPFKEGRLDATGIGIVSMAGALIPSTITFKSATGGRLIELSTDGIDYFIPSYDTSTAGMLILTVTANISHVRFTGLENDTWRIL